MLDIYILKNSKTESAFPNEDNYIGSLKLDEFKQIHEVILKAQKKGIQWSFFNDSSFNKSQVRTLLNMIEIALRNPELKKDNFKEKVYRKVVAILATACKFNRGIICFSD